MKYDFDHIINRKNTNCLKYDFMEEFHKPKDSMPLWVADMDFRVSKEIQKKLYEMVDHGIFGYTSVKSSYAEVVINWFENRFSWSPKEEWLLKTPGIVFALNACIQVYTDPQDAVLIQTPVYYPFRNAVINNNRKLVTNPLKLENHHYEIDFDDLEKKIIQNNVKMMILCSPHNPVGRVWTREELDKIGKLCVKYDVIIVSDEIHCDFVYPGHTHTVIASLDEEIASRCIICTAPSKTFNLAGLETSNIFVPNLSLRKKMIDWQRNLGMSNPNMMGLAACEAAYTSGESWLEELKVYLQGNLDAVREYIESYLPGITLIEPEGTYLIWLDCRDLGYTDKELNRKVIEAGLWLDGGSMFGTEGEGFMRVNIACPRSELMKAMEKFCSILPA